MIDLVEKVARAIVKYDGGDWERDPLDQTRFAVGQAKAVIPIVLEAAANAEPDAYSLWPKRSASYTEGFWDGADKMKSAIRALGDKDV